MGGVKSLAAQADGLPYREETLRLLDEIIAETGGDEAPDSQTLERLQQLRGGEPYRWLYANVFPALRRTNVIVSYTRKLQSLPAVAWQPAAHSISTEPSGQIAVMPPAAAPANICKPFYMAIYTNMAYDALLIPNIGIDIYVGKGWSVNANWHYGWWKSHPRHWWWRSYGGDLEMRRWFGGHKPLDGHHLGVYGQMFTYDFEAGGRGYLAPRWSWGAGLSYGYSLAIKPRLSLDFSLGMGYMGGKYYDYLPDGDCYVWQSTKQRRWFGPTKLEVSLVWLIGCGNRNLKKGGKL